ncbi:diaminopimelate epimerase [Prevotella sp. CAG:924]|nr:diaminopimelate epimerase [Prevotella sp. CAG:924]
MTTNIQFTKMHGAGNDYIYVNTLLYNVPDPAKAAEVWSRYHTGVGSDGLVLIGAPSDEKTADFSMRIFNNDGSEAMMCGNASRCIAKYLYERGMTDKTTIRLETLSGVKILQLHLDSEKKVVESVTVDMLEPALEQSEQYTGVDVARKYEDMWKEMGAHDSKFVSMGNPHYVIFVDDVEKLDIARYGRILENDTEVFPQRCNIEFVTPVGEGRLRTRVWERGSGITMACGTGACATAVAASQLGKAPKEVNVCMDGGTLHIFWADNNHVMMSGPAAFVFDGSIALPE